MSSSETMGAVSSLFPITRSLGRGTLVSFYVSVLYQLKLFFLKYTPTGQLSHYQLFMVHIDKLHGTGHACMFTYMCTLIHYILYIISVYSLISNHKNHYMSKLFEWCYSHHLVVSLLNKHPTHDC